VKKHTIAIVWICLPKIPLRGTQTHYHQWVPLKGAHGGEETQDLMAISENLRKREKKPKCHR
jgi:hypothetical protein